MTLPGPFIWPRLRSLTLALTFVALLAVPALTTSVSAQEVRDPTDTLGAQLAVFDQCSVVADRAGDGKVIFIHPSRDWAFTPPGSELVVVIKGGPTQAGLEFDCVLLPA